MQLTLSPQRGLPGQPEAIIEVAGDVLTIDGKAYDLSAVPEGGEGIVEGDTPFVGPVTRIDGVLRATIIARLGSDTAPVQTGPWVIEAATGRIAIPAIRNMKGSAT